MAKSKSKDWRPSPLDNLARSIGAKQYGSQAMFDKRQRELMQQMKNVAMQQQMNMMRPPTLVTPRAGYAAKFGQVVDPSVAWWSGNPQVVTLDNRPIQFNTLTIPNNNMANFPDPDEARRKTADQVQYLDLKVGDKIEKADNSYNPFTVVRVDRREGHITVEDYDGDTTMWRLNNRQIVLDRMKLIERAKGDRPKVAFSSVIMPEKDKTSILDAIGQIDNFDLIFDTWGFGDVLEKGRAVSLLFYGVPGTGKTLMAQAIADKYDYDLKVISTAEIESSEPGQAERNIKAYFEAASKNKNTVLLFDECDSLIADRRGIGMILGAQVNALLTCLENFEGIAIFTTNRLEKMDEAFNRRLSLKLKFEMPDQAARVEIWKRMYPDKAPLAKNIDWDRIASVEITGGYIKNVVLRSARRAAASKLQKITNQIIIDALIEEVETLSEFQDAVDSSNLPKLRGGGQGVSVERTTSMVQTVEQAGGQETK